MSISTIIIICLTVLNLVCNIIFSKLYRKYKTAYNEEHNRLVNIEQEYSKLVESYKIKKKNKEEADEKISDLHNGTMSADDVLPKRKS